MRPITWTVTPFHALSTTVLYTILRLRQQIFLVEQQCLYTDCDGKDQQALHLIGNQDGHIMAYARFLAPGITCPEANFGRLLVHPQARGNGLGHALVEQTLKAVQENYGPVPLRIYVRPHLESFYHHHGFHTASEAYFYHNAPHIDMLKRP